MVRFNSLLIMCSIISLISLSQNVSGADQPQADKELKSWSNPSTSKQGEDWQLRPLIHFDQERIYRDEGEYACDDSRSE